MIDFHRRQTQFNDTVHAVSSRHIESWKLFRIALQVSGRECWAFCFRSGSARIVGQNERQPLVS
jgi:hypothetical protein